MQDNVFMQYHHPDVCDRAAIALIAPLEEMGWSASQIALLVQNQAFCAKLRAFLHDAAQDERVAIHRMLEG